MRAILVAKLWIPWCNGTIELSALQRFTWSNTINWMDIESFKNVFYIYKADDIYLFLFLGVLVPESLMLELCK